MTRPRYGLAAANYIAPDLLLKYPSNRGGSGTNALTNTLDPSLYPTTPPESQFSSGVPKIAGSEGGFIGLIIGLGVLALLCCCLVFYLLHTRPHGGRGGNKNHPSTTGAPTAAPAAGLFASRRKRNAGWVQQTDEFDYDSGEEDGELADRKGAARYAYAGVLMHDQADASSAPPPAPRGVRADAYTDPFDPERLPENVRRQQAPLPRTSLELEEVSHNTANRTPNAGPVIPSFEGGTRFKEQF